MGVSIPEERCYYYECSEGVVRLNHFIPTLVLEEMVQGGRISAQVLEDFPDGVDLDCTEPDFADFDRTYGYRPPLAPDSLRHAFLALLSSTEGWQSFRGTGLIAAAELEALVPEVAQVAREVEEEGEPEVAEGGLPGVMSTAPLRHPGAPGGRPGRRSVAMREARLQQRLTELPVRGVDPGLRMGEQHFRPVRMDRGMSAHEVFSRLQLGQERE